jgi:hypothetical protein
MTRKVTLEGCTLGPSLFAPRKVCVVCGVESRDRVRNPDPNAPNIIGITPYVYYRKAGEKGGQPKNAKRVRVCEQCFQKALTSGRLGWNIKGNALWNAISASLLDLYKHPTEDATK